MGENRILRKAQERFSVEKANGFHMCAVQNAKRGHQRFLFLVMAIRATALMRRMPPPKHGTGGRVMADRYNDLIIDLRYSARHAKIENWMMLSDAADAIEELNEKYQKSLADIIRKSPPTEKERL